MIYTPHQVKILFNPSMVHVRFTSQGKQGRWLHVTPDELAVYRKAFEDRSVPFSEEIW